MFPRIEIANVMHITQYYCIMPDITYLYQIKQFISIEEIIYSIDFSMGMGKWMKYCKRNLKITHVSRLAEWWSASRSDISGIIELFWLLLAYGLINNQKLFNFNWCCFLAFWRASLYFRYFNILNHVIFYNISECKQKQYFNALNMFDIFLLQFSRLLFIEHTFDFTIKMFSVVTFCIFFLINHVSFWMNMETVSWCSAFYKNVLQNYKLYFLIRQCILLYFIMTINSTIYH